MARAMTSGSAESVFLGLSLALTVFAACGLLTWISVMRPRLGLYALLALAPTQFIFIPVRGFFISPADVLALAAAGLLSRLASGNPLARAAMRLHVMLGLMLAAYVVGFVVLGHFSQTLVRLPLAILASVLACELLVSRRHFALATSALVLAGLLDAAYGAFYLAAAAPLHPTRFSGMMGVNFSAIVILTAAAVAFARVARTRRPLELLLPGMLALVGVATLSKIGILALAVAGAVVVWPLATPTNRRLIATATALFLVIGLSQEGIRGRLGARASAEVQLDGVSRTSTEVRATVLQAAWEALGEQPLVGVGFLKFQGYSLKNAEIDRSTGGLGYATHNAYLEVLVEGGLLAFIPFLLHFLPHARAMRSAWHAIARERDVLVGAAVSGLIVVMISAGVANVLLHYLFWGMSGVALACLTRLHDERASYA